MAPPALALSTRLSRSGGNSDSLLFNTKIEKLCVETLPMILELVENHRKVSQEKKLQYIRD